MVFKDPLEQNCSAIVDQAEPSTHAFEQANNKIDKKNRDSSLPQW